MNMEIVWLGQAGLLIKDDDITILVDPYLSDSCGEINPKLKRRVAVDESFFDVRPDVIICTHSHRDHTDLKTLKKYLDKNSDIHVMAPQGAWDTVKKLGGNHNYIRFNRHTVVTVKKCTFTAVLAEHEDVHPIGVIVEKDGTKLYITGDTLYNSDIFEDIPKDIRDVLGDKHGQRINTMVTAVISESADKPYIAMTPEVGEAMDKLRTFLFETVYLNPLAKSEENKAKDMLAYLFEYFVKHPEKMPDLYVRNIGEETVERCVCDYISGMTDRYAIDLYSDLFIPKVWRGRA